MKRLLISLSVLFVAITFYGCSKSPRTHAHAQNTEIKKPKIIGTVDVVNNIDKVIPYNNYGSINFHILGVYQDNNNTLSKIDNVLKEVKKEYGNKKDAKKIKSTLVDKYRTTVLKRNFFGRSIKSKTPFDCAYDYCIKRVELGYYGYFRNVNEKHELIVTCAERELNKNEKIKIYSGSSSYAETLHSQKFRNILKLNIERGKDTKIEKEYYKVIVKKADNKIYLYATFSKNIINHGSFKYAVKYIKKQLKEEKLKSILQKAELTVDFF